MGENLKRMGKMGTVINLEPRRSRKRRLNLFLWLLLLFFILVIIAAGYLYYFFYWPNSQKISSLSQSSPSHLGGGYPVGRQGTLCEGWKGLASL
ncbi:exported hypothetical protein [[Clostridium] ultunense Esp]|nr:exported hypothetical protein [[Clostridium] ultunense Esp]